MKNRILTTILATVVAISAPGAAVSTVPDAVIPLDAALAQAAPRDVRPIFGLVHAASAATPSDKLIAPLHPVLWRAGRRTPDLVPRMRAIDASPVHALSDVWGYPMDGRPAPFADMAAFSDQVRRQAERLGPAALYDIWNEANSRDFWLGWFPESPTRAQDAERRFYDTFEAAYRAIEEVHGRDAKVAGPSLNRYDFEALRRFMDAMLERGVRVDTLAWHDFPSTPEGVAAIEAHLKEARRAFIDDPRYASVGVRHLLVGESMSYETSMSPGLVLAHLYHAEAGGASGLLRACWDEPGQGRRPAVSNCWNDSLDGLLTPDGAPRAAYWAVAAYAGSGKGRVGSKMLAPGIYAIAARPTAGSARILVASARRQPVAVRVPKRASVVRMARIPLIGDGRAAMVRPEFRPVPAGTVQLGPQEVVMFELADR